MYKNMYKMWFVQFFQIASNRYILYTKLDLNFVDSPLVSREKGSATGVSKSFLFNNYIQPL